MATYKQLTAQLEKLHKEVAIAQQKEIAAVIEEIKRKIVDYDLTAEELERRTDLEKETIDAVRKVLQEEFQKG